MSSPEVVLEVYALRDCGVPILERLGNRGRGPHTLREVQEIIEGMESDSVKDELALCGFGHSLEPVKKVHARLRHIVCDAETEELLTLIGSEKRMERVAASWRLSQ